MDGVGRRQRGGACLSEREGRAGSQPLAVAWSVILGLVARAAGTRLPTVRWGLWAAFP